MMEMVGADREDTLDATAAEAQEVQHASVNPSVVVSMKIDLWGMTTVIGVIAEEENESLRAIDIVAPLQAKNWFLVAIENLEERVAVKGGGTIIEIVDGEMEGNIAVEANLMF
jgi:hypothetical protein